MTINDERRRTMANYKLTLEEQETIISYNGAEQTVYVCTGYLPDIEYYDKLCVSNPEWITKVKENEYYKHYEISEKRYSNVRLKPPRQMSDEEREKKREHLAQIRASKTSGNVGK